MNKKISIIFILMISFIVLLVSIPNLLSVYQNNSIENKMIFESIDSNKNSKGEKEKLESLYERMNIIAKSYMYDEIVLMEKYNSLDSENSSTEDILFIKDVLKALKKSGLLRDVDIEGEPDILNMRTLTYTDKETFQSVMAYRIDFNINDSFVSMLVDSESKVVYALDFQSQKTSSVLSVDDLALAWGNYWNLPVEGVEFIGNGVIHVNYDSKIMGILKFQEKGGFSISLQTIESLEGTN